MRDIIEELLTKVKDDLTELDVDSMYDDMLDECYSFESVGGPFEYLQPSAVLKEMSPTTHRCGFADWLDGERFYEVGDSYYHGTDLERIKDELIDELETELSDLDDQLDRMDQDDIDAGVNDVVDSQKAELEELVVKLRKYSF